MFKLFGKKHLSVLLALVSLTATNHALMADECCYSESNRIYIGGFGGELFSNSTRITQTGTAFFLEAMGGPMAIDARGHAHKKKTAGFGGVQIGYEWTQCPSQIGCSNWSITPAAELEAYWYRQTKKGHLINPSNRLPEHDFADSFRLNGGVYFVNGVLSLNNCCFSKFSPYIGGGIGAARIFINNAKSLQVAPPERGINHFNSDRSDSAWAFAAQAKAGIRYNIWDRVHIFGEYRFLYVDSTRYLFGSTKYPNHAPTSTWNVDLKSTTYNAFTFGLQYDLY